MAKDKETKEQAPDPVSPPVAAPAAPAALTVNDQVAQIVGAIRVVGPQLLPAQRAVIIAALTDHQRPTPAGPSPYDGKRRFRFVVAYQDMTAEIEATSPTEARAMFNDSVATNMSPPSPKLVKVTMVEELHAEQAA